MRNNSTWAPLALSPIPWPSNAWNPWYFWAVAFGVIVLNVLPAALYVVVYASLHGGARGATAANFPPFQLLIAQIVTYVPVVALLLAVLPSLAKVSLSQLGIRMPTLREFAIGLAGTIAMWLAVIAIGGAVAALTHRHDTENAVALLKGLKSTRELTVFFLIACVFAPIVEELTFRVFVFNALTKAVSVRGAIVLSGILFGLVHAIGSWAQVLTIGLPLACGGMVLAYVYATTRNFWSNVTTHACFNAINVIALVVFHAS